MLTGSVVSLLVVLLQFVDPAPEMSITYLQDSQPLMEIAVVALDDAESDVYEVLAQPVSFPPDLEAEEGTEVRFRIEQSDLYAHIYLVHGDRGAPLVVDVGAVRGQLLELDSGEDRQIQLGGVSTEGADESPGGVLPGGEVYWQSRPPAGVLSYPAGGVVFIARSTP